MNNLGVCRKGRISPAFNRAISKHEGSFELLAPKATRRSRGRSGRPPLVLRSGGSNTLGREAMHHRGRATRADDPGGIDSKPPQLLEPGNACADFLSLVCITMVFLAVPAPSPDPKLLTRLLCLMPVVWSLEAML